MAAAVTAEGEGLPHGSTASDGALLDDAGRRVYQALTGAAVGAAVAVAEGDLPHGSRTSDGSLLADAGRRVYQAHAGPTQGRCGGGGGGAGGRPVRWQRS